MTFQKQLAREKKKKKSLSGSYLVRATQTLSRQCMYVYTEQAPALLTIPGGLCTINNALSEHISYNLADTNGFVTF